MQSDRGESWDFKGEVSPHLEVLLQISLGLTKNGRDATRLTRETIAEASRSWDESLPEENCHMRLYDILTRRYYNSFEQLLRPPVPIHGDNSSESLISNSRLHTVGTADSRQNLVSIGKSNEHVNYFNAITSLPVTFRSAMILSYVHGFSNVEIAELAGARPHEIASLLHRGCGLIREELFAHLMGNNPADTDADGAAPTE